MSTTNTIPSGAKCLTPKQVCDKLSRRKSWLWQRLKNDPNFPRPVYFGPSAPVFIEADLDEWLERLYRSAP